MEEVVYHTNSTAMEELVTHTNSLPQSYMIPKPERAEMADVLFPMSTINYRLPDNNNLSCQQELRNEIYAACENGMFQVYNHGISKGVTDGAFRAANSFFSLPNTEMRSGIKKGDCMLYSSSLSNAWGCENNFHYWKDVLRVNLRSRKSMNGWPAQPPNLKDDVWRFGLEARKFMWDLLSNVSLGLVLDPGSFRTQFNCASDISICHYPPSPDKLVTLGSAKYEDFNLITLSWQENIDGLQIYEGGRWKRVVPRSDALLVTVGPHLEVISNGRFKAPATRIVNSHDKAGTSISYNVVPHTTCKVKPWIQEPHNCRSNPQEPEKYRSYEFQEFMENYINNRHDLSILDNYRVSL